MASSTLFPENGERRTIWLLLVAFVVVFLWSGINPADRFTWFLEVLPAIAGLLMLTATYRRFRFTILLYTLMLVHAIVLMVGGHYTYAEVPLFNWIRDHFHVARNDYDRLGHFMQGFVPAMIAREALIRKQVVKRGPWLYFIVFSICMMVSSVYELFEFLMARLTGSAADAFLGSQGDIWDTDWDMFFCLLGSNTALLTLSHWHDRLLSRAAVPAKDEREALATTEV